jgi:hypothetical protein
MVEFFEKAGCLGGANSFDTSIVLAPLWLEWQYEVKPSFKLPLHYYHFDPKASEQLAPWRPLLAYGPPWL